MHLSDCDDSEIGGVKEERGSLEESRALSKVDGKGYRYTWKLSE